MSGSRSSRRFRDLSSEDAALVHWGGDGYPAELKPLMTRLVTSGIWTLSVNQGWWPLVKRLDADIARLAPEYRFAQLSEDPSEALEGLPIVRWLTLGRDPGRVAAAIHASETS